LKKEACTWTWTQQLEPGHFLLPKSLAIFKWDAVDQNPGKLNRVLFSPPKMKEHRKYLVISEKMMGTSSTTVRIFRFRL